MNVLFVTSGNSSVFEVTPFIRTQGESLSKRGINLHYYLIAGKGVGGYLQNIKRIKQKLKVGDYDVIHAHYSLTALAVLLAFPKVPVVASYMGSDVYGSYNSRRRIIRTDWWITFVAILIQPFLSYVICKSPNIKKYVFKRNASIIPNGVDLGFYYPITTSHDPSIKSPIRTVLFVGDKTLRRKNFSLVERAVDHLNEMQVRIIAPYPVSQDELRTLYNEADVLVLASLQEGSPNVVKEAMACNVPIVSTDVGDVRWLLEGVEGHYIADFDPYDFAQKIRCALDYGKRTQGRLRLIKLGMDADSVADRIINIYNEIKKQR